MKNFVKVEHLSSGTPSYEYPKSSKGFVDLYKIESIDINKDYMILEMHSGIAKTIKPNDEVLRFIKKNMED